MRQEDFAAHHVTNDQAAPPTPGKDRAATPDPAPTSQTDPPRDLDKRTDPGPTTDSALAPEPEPTLDVEPTADSDLTPEHQSTLHLESTSGPEPTPEHSLVTRRKGLAGMTDLVQRHVLPLLIPPVLLLVITADRRDTGLSLAPPERERADDRADCHRLAGRGRRARRPRDRLRRALVSEPRDRPPQRSLRVSAAAAEAVEAQRLLHKLVRPMTPNRAL